MIAAVNGYAIGGGHVLHVLCDLTIAADTRDASARAGPRVGSFDAGFGTAYLARVVGEKRAREIWFLCRQYDAADRRALGAGQRGRPRGRAAGRGAPLGRRDPRAVADRAAVPQAVVQHRHASTSPASGSSRSPALREFVDADEAREGVAAFNEKRPPDFAPYRSGASR